VVVGRCAKYNANCVRNMQSYKKPNKQKKLHLVGILLKLVLHYLVDKSPMHNNHKDQQPTVLSCYVCCVMLTLLLNLPVPFE